MIVKKLGKPRTGTIHLGAEHRGERVQIIIEDDGAGINRERVLSQGGREGHCRAGRDVDRRRDRHADLPPGLLDGEAEVTAVSGRGVGMDVVKKKVQALGGRVSVQSTPGKGSKLRDYVAADAWPFSTG